MSRKSEENNCSLVREYTDPDRMQNIYNRFIGKVSAKNGGVAIEN